MESQNSKSLPYSAPPLLNLLSQQTPQLMGILNVTPDSFSDGGLYQQTRAAIDHGRELFRLGASIVDVGGESSAPGRGPVSADEEIRRVLPVVGELSKSGIVSVDTYKSDTARACLQAGAVIINDISALRADSGMRSTIAEHHAFVVLMHSKEDDHSPHASRPDKRYDNIVTEIADFLRRRVDFATAGGIANDRIILDPGMGAFLSNDSGCSWELLAGLDRLIQMLQPFPLLIGTSRKGFLGGTLAERDPISQLTALAAGLKGAKIIRTHRADMAKQFFEAWNRLFV